MAELTEDQMREYKQVFDLYDKDGDGTINTNMLGTVMRCLGLNPTEDEIKAWVNEYDKDCDGTLDFEEEFLPLMKVKIVDLDDEADLCLAFEAFDRDGSGHIAATEFRHVMKILGQKASDEEIDRMLELIGTDDEGLIDYRAFVHTILHDFSLSQIRSELS
mmetsp:Transcript_82196/g.266186  ORF Transcript_82196/g.266186 Transcript_82196/m.266186 type:complete len:161 (+) Transcript_82196:95-577(+)|eukprot:CAMPEP_0177200992 /NCGR_PEP_ID=MMETSP0367-20130122/26516_1 /TAXON_ID=447022 ORGANISM="Scrippsiella hangoei-like, Strain SHHI-4" /NCGR_SAMPLE_ID=MMETSP0367 /ASSEMBLY_ACC=CAM_ASM_000362 /LENGTH=160 /DNA_ID=CAMNT_0018649471 /DNA_START=85 /DNA_END=567 /DNA_ORIENTATION=-